jgi:pimeloyl-ACP methyl ester carboxylesterase
MSRTDHRSKTGPGLRRREFLELAAAALAAGACASRAPGSRAGTSAGGSPPLDGAAFHASRRLAETSFGKIAYVERGSGDAAVFLHGLPLNGFQWRGALDRLSAHRRCIALDFMGMGYSEIPEGQSFAASAQTAMLAAFLDRLGIGGVDLVASDSGGAVAQLFAVQHPGRVKTLLLSNCDVEPDSPPAKVMPIIEMARAGTLADSLVKWLADKPLARAEFGKAVYVDPAHPDDDAIDYYFKPVVSSPLRRAQFHAINAALDPNPLAGIEAALRRSTVPMRVVWGTGDDIFAPSDADYLDRIFPRSRGVRRVPGARLFFQEEYPDIIAEEARRLWGVSE